MLVDDIFLFGGIIGQIEQLVDGNFNVCQRLSDDNVASLLFLVVMQLPVSNTQPECPAGPVVLLHQMFTALRISLAQQSMGVTGIPPFNMRVSGGSNFSWRVGWDESS